MKSNHYSLKFSFGFLFLVTLISCGDINQKYKEQQGIAIDANNQDLIRKAALMETNLSQKRRFYSSTQGIFIGETSLKVSEYPLFQSLLDPKLIDSNGNFQVTIRLNLIATLPANPGPGVRTEPQITSDLNLLSFNNTEVNFWFSKSPSNSYSCIFSSIHPDLDAGKINLRDANCADSYSISIQPEPIIQSDPNSRVTNDTISLRSGELSQKLQSGEVNTVSKLHIIMTTPRLNKTIEFWAAKDNSKNNSKEKL